ncbi:ribulose bisphosphate carboxylase small subunit, chloroplastic-like [Phragmites australis]|uniref:ribulose bisphosphate carboxylase small subunit, chloroplastic-like n=1 Tax=Phragmites australis TaxID=29695 RepID=UPI002D796FD3|nr:ribulose bisphosphate carboxylase small subunit, chloroplastic-like [Phragmites australis]
MGKLLSCLKLASPLQLRLLLPAIAVSFLSLSCFSLSVKNMFINTTASLVAGASIFSLRPAKLAGRRLPGPSCRARTASHGFRTYCMKTWNPFTNTRYEALSYLPPLTEESIAKEIEFIMSKGWVPCLEFDEAGRIHRSNSQMPGYYDGRYWTLWKLPMFGCTDASQVLREAEECRKEYPDAYIRLIAFDSSRQCQCMSFVIHKPSSSPPAAAAAPTARTEASLA